MWSHMTLFYQARGVCIELDFDTVVYMNHVITNDLLIIDPPFFPFTLCIPLAHLT